MKRIALNTLALAALFGGGLTLTHAADAKASVAQLEVGPTCGKCTCSDGQSCSSTWYGSKCIPGAG